MTRDDLAAMLMQTSDTDPFPLQVPYPGQQPQQPPMIPFDDRSLRQGAQPSLDAMDPKMMMDDWARRLEVPDYKNRAPISPEEAEAARKRILDNLNKGAP